LEHLYRMLDHCRALEERAAALYRAFSLAARARGDPGLCALWTALAREEEEHAHTLAAARADLTVVEGWRTLVEGWDEAVRETEECLAAAERLGAGASPDEQLASALALEMTEIDTLRHALLTASNHPEARAASAAHAERLASAAVRSSDDPRVRLEAALLLARSRLKGTT
jgi:rubrerythrin